MTLRRSLPLFRQRGYTRRRDDIVARVVARELRREAGPGSPPLSGGVQAAIDVTRLLPAPAVRAAQNLVGHVELGAIEILRPAITGIGGQVVLTLSYSITGVTLRRRDRLLADTRALASRVRQTTSRLVSGAPPIAIELPVPWVLRASVTLVPARRDSFRIAQAADESMPDLDAFVASTIGARSAAAAASGEPGPGGRPGPGSPAILAIDARLSDAETLREAFRRTPLPVPWTRVYHVLGSTATLILAVDQAGEPGEGAPAAGPATPGRGQSTPSSQIEEDGPR
jgi:hypothetical protein